MITAESKPIAVTIAPSGPYVGLRPYERHEQHLLFARSRDAEFLTNKVLSSPLTVFYGQSGLGKSSLLRALVIPRIEACDTRVAYFDAWSGEKPEEAFKDELIKLATTLGIADAGAGAPTLTELVRLLKTADERGLVLVLDQFEEFLLAHSQRLDPLRKELAALTRATGLDVQIVLSLREEFIAALEPFREEILGLFNSTYRLEPLDETGLRDAIVCPVEAFESSYEPGLVERLIRDLKAKPAGTDGVEPGGSVELPVLQLVCSQLWEAASGRGRTLIPLALYESLGGMQQILNDYVSKAIPRGWFRKLRTARLLRLLAPPSGFKISYSVSDLASVTAIDPEKVAAELDRLSRFRILRVREYRSSIRYELQHDALIPVVAPWRDRILHHARQLRLITIGVATAVSLLVVAGAVALNEARRSYEMTEGALTELRQMGDSARALNAQRVFDNAAAHLLWQQGGSARLDRLRELLQSNEDLLPTGYGTATTGAELVWFPVDEDWPVTFQFSTGRELDWGLFQNAWQSAAWNITTQWGIPVPRFLRLQAEESLPGRRIRITGVGIDTVDFSLPLYEGEVFISERQLPDASREFLNRFRSAWRPIPQLEDGGPWWIVPRWSLPVWKVSGQLANDGSSLPAILLANHLLEERPATLLPEHVLELLLARVREQYPETVEEAVSARGSRLRDDLVELVKLEHPLTHLPMVLDALAHYPKESSRAAAAAVVRDLQGPGFSLPSAFHGPWDDARPAEVPVSGDSTSSPGYRASASYREAYASVVENWLPAVEPPIRIYLGSDLESRWVRGDSLGPELSEAVALFRDEFVNRFGFEPPTNFRDNSWDRSLASDAFRIQLLDETQTDAVTMRVGAAEGVPGLLSELQARATRSRVHWLTAEATGQILFDFDLGLRRWLDERYSRTDLKLLLRAVVAPDSLELYATAADSVGTLSEKSIRYPAWLLASLPFWSEIEEGAGPARAAQHLRATQRARLRGPTVPRPNDRVSGYVEAGLLLMADGWIAEAQTEFAAAIELDRASAIEHFLAARRGQLYQELRARLAPRCDDLEQVSLSRGDQLDLAELIRSGVLATEDEVRDARLCLLSGVPRQRHEKRSAVITEILGRHAAPSRWPPQEAAWFAHEVLSGFDPLRDDPQLPQRAARFLQSAASRLDAAGRYDLFNDLFDICAQEEGRNWCWQVADGYAEQHPDGLIPVSLAYHLRSSERPDELRRAIRLVEQFESNASTSDLPPSDLAFGRELARLDRATAYSNLAALGEKQYAQRATEGLSSLLTSPFFGQEAHLQLAEQLIQQQRLSEANSLLVRAVEQWPGEISFHIERFFVRLLQGDTAAAGAIARAVLQRTGTSSDAQFLAALGQILTRTGDWEVAGREFLHTDHDYVPYAAMMLYAFTPGESRAEARALLAGRWEEVDTSTWRVRLHNGDSGARREMLIGYYLGKVQAPEIFDVLENDSVWSRSELRHLPINRRGLLCEAYFYDALLARSQGDTVRMRKRLQQAVDTDYPRYFEHRMATFLLREGTR